MDLNESLDNPLDLIVRVLITVMLLMNLYYQIQEKFRSMIMIFDWVRVNESSCIWKVKLLTIVLFMCLNVATGINIFSASMDLMLASTDSIDLLNNALSALVLQDIDQMTSIFYSYWIRTHFNQLT